MGALENPGLIKWPGLPMAKYGKNSLGDNIYRVIHAKSRRHLVFPIAGDGPAKWILKYREEARRGNWIMECWRTIGDYTSGQGVDTYAKTSGICLLADGEYDLCFEFENGLPQVGGMDKLIYWISAGKTRRPIENALAVRAEWEAQEKDRDNSMEGRIRNALPAFGNAPVSGYGGGSGTKTAKDLRIGAHQTPFQVPRGTVRSRKSEQETIVYQGTFNEGSLIQHA